MEYTPRPLPPRRRKTSTPSVQEPLSAFEAVSKDFFAAEPEDPSRRRTAPKPVSQWGARDLVSHWLKTLHAQNWTFGLVDHTNQAALGKVFRERLDAGHGAETLKSCVDTYLTTESVHRNAHTPWKHFRSRLDELVRQQVNPGRGSDTRPRDARTLDW